MAPIIIILWNLEEKLIFAPFRFAYSAQSVQANCNCDAVYPSSDTHTHKTHHTCHSKFISFEFVNVVGSIKLSVASYVDAGRLISLTYNNNKMIIIQYCALRVWQQRVCYMIACTSLYLFSLPPIFYLNRFSFRTRGRKIVCKQLWHLPMPNIIGHRHNNGKCCSAVSGMLKCYARLHTFFSVCFFFVVRQIVWLNGMKLMENMKLMKLVCVQTIVIRSRGPWSVCALEIQLQLRFALHANLFSIFERYRCRETQANEWI